MLIIGVRGGWHERAARGNRAATNDGNKGGKRLAVDAAHISAFRAFAAHSLPSYIILRHFMIIKKTHRVQRVAHAAKCAVRAANNTIRAGALLFSLISCNLIVCERKWSNRKLFKLNPNSDAQIECAVRSLSASEIASATGNRGSVPVVNISNAIPNGSSA